MTEITLAPRACDVAVAAVPAGAAACVRYPSGDERVIPGEDEATLFVVVPGDRVFLGWGASVCTYRSAEGITRTCRVEHQAVWRQAAALVAAGGVVYVEHHRTAAGRVPGWAPVRTHPGTEDPAAVSHARLEGTARIRGAGYWFTGCPCGWTSHGPLSQDQAGEAFAGHLAGRPGSPGDGPAAVYHVQLTGEPLEDIGTAWGGCACGWVDLEPRDPGGLEDEHDRHMDEDRQARASVRQAAGALT